MYLVLLVRWGEREPFPSRSWLKWMFLNGCFSNRFKPRPLSRGGGLAGCQQARAMSAQGGRRPAEDRVAAT
ncbi:hypothetical protein NDU88_004623 [Pleurodeles waltl]|uniref:Uncharacterized protein n=1 Tax=Pleurodeles waltl TaxID=8319 RepID=A0AAV7TRS5_PLEWA|nr:hypothetical protein NDU88_004623 [Pleurodeles waltl]